MRFCNLSFASFELGFFILVFFLYFFYFCIENVFYFYIIPYVFIFYVYTMKKTIYNAIVDHLCDSVDNLDEFKRYKKMGYNG